jgi:hypothetical protein
MELVVSEKELLGISINLYGCLMTIIILLLKRANALKGGEGKR